MSLAYIVGGDQAWMLTSTALVQVMTPGVAFYYGGLVGEEAAVSTMMLSYGCMGIVTLLWSWIGYSMSFGPSLSTGIIGNDEDGTLNKLDANSLPYGTAASISPHVFSMYQLMFAIITSAIISGSVVGKIKYIYFMIFTAIWHLLIYCPLAHWIFYYNGWLAQYGVVDFAGGMVIHTSSGVASLVLAFLIDFTNPQKVKAKHVVPHNVPFVLLGAALLWFGWFGFNAGSAVSAGYGAGLALTNTQLGAAAAMFTWGLLDIIFPAASPEADQPLVGEAALASIPAPAPASSTRPAAPASSEVVAVTGVSEPAAPAPWSFKSLKLFRGLPTAVGAATGAVVGLVGITPGAGYVSPMSAIFIGFYTTLSVYFLPRLMRRLAWVDDRLDCFVIHGIGGMVGSGLVGLFADFKVSGALNIHGKEINGAFYGNADQLAYQCAGVTVAAVYSAIGTAIIFWFIWALARIINDTIAVPHEEHSDKANHGEIAYSPSPFKNQAGPTSLPSALNLSELVPQAQAAPRGAGVRAVPSQAGLELTATAAADAPKAAP